MLKSVCISLLQPASGRLFLPWWWCCCCFDAGVQLILSLNALITAQDGGISLHLHMLTLMLTCYLSLIVVFHRDVFGTKTSKSPGWCTLRHALRVYIHTHTHFQILSLPSSQCCRYPTLFELGAFDVLLLPYPQPHRAFSCPLLVPGSLLYKKTLEQFSCGLLNFLPALCSLRGSR